MALPWAASWVAQPPLAVELRGARNTILGATEGGAIASSAQGSRNGMRFTVETSPGTRIQVVTDQTEIRVGDYVNVEQAGSGTANVRRVSEALCEAVAGNAVDTDIQVPALGGSGTLSGSQETAAGGLNRRADRSRHPACGNPLRRLNCLWQDAASAAERERADMQCRWSAWVVCQEFRVERATSPQ